MKTGWGWWEEYKCGCVSKTVLRKKDLLGYCGHHGDDRRMTHREVPDGFWDDEKKPANHAALEA